MSWLSKLISKQKNAKIVVVGGAQAGKTTLIHYLETGKPVTESFGPTFGVDIRKSPVKIASWSLTTSDLGGQKIFVDYFWEQNIKLADAIIYVIDSTIKKESMNDEFEKSLYNFEYMLTSRNPKQPLLILLNKQDLKEKQPLTVEEAIAQYRITTVKGSFFITPTSAKFGDGVLESMKWLIEKLS